MEELPDGDDNEMLATLTAVVASAQECMEESSGKEEEENPWGGSCMGKAENLPRDIEGAYQNVVAHYFTGERSLCSEDHFLRRFGVPRSVFHKVHDELIGETVFVHKEDCTGKKACIHWCDLCVVFECCRTEIAWTAVMNTHKHLSLLPMIHSKNFAGWLLTNLARSV